MRTAALLATWSLATAAAAQPAPQAVVPTRAQAEMPSLTAACDRAAPSSGLAYADDEAFPTRLASAFSARPAVLTIDVPRPFAPETMPDRLHGWLVETARAGGSVSVQEIPCGARAGRGIPVNFGVRAFLTRPGTAVNAAVRGYDAVLWVEQATGAVNQVQFVRRPG